MIYLLYVHTLPVIRVRNLGKKYPFGGPQEKYLALRDAMVISLKTYQQYA
jgi:hypothetical protein